MRHNMVVRRFAVWMEAHPPAYGLMMFAIAYAVGLLVGATKSGRVNWIEPLYYSVTFGMVWGAVHHDS